MKKRFVSTTISGIAILAVLAAVPIAQAGDTSDTISIRFAADEPSGSFFGSMVATDHAGAPGYVSANWNNAAGQTDQSFVDPTSQLFTIAPLHVPLAPLVRDTNGVAKATNAS